MEKESIIKIPLGIEEQIEINEERLNALEDDVKMIRQNIEDILWVIKKMGGNGV